ncbi:MAG TPA: hypothetical protein VMN04_00040 [Thermoanaerobaculia bacterium]|nr:hypothetical protein [Thermoanaerobaculia bacterium]
MADQPKPPDDHSDAVHAAFDDLHEKIGKRATSDSKIRVEALREAVLARDAASVKAHLDAMKESHGWLWAELTAHPRIAELIDKLALIGL